MSRIYTVREEILTDIADAIREVLGTTDTMTVEEMPEIIESILNDEGGAFDSTKGNLSHFAYQVDSEKGEIILRTVLYQDIYTENNNYDVVIPNTLGGYQVVIK